MVAGTGEAALDFDVFDADTTHDMWELMARFRRERPVAPIQGGFYYVSRYEDARAMLRDETLFSNVGGMRRTGLEVPLEDSSIGELGPPVHAPARKLSTTAAQGGRVLKLAAPFVRETTETLMQEICARRGGDLMADYSLPLTAGVIAWLLGMDPRERSAARAVGRGDHAEPAHGHERDRAGAAATRGPFPSSPSTWSSW